MNNMLDFLIYFVNQLSSEKEENERPTKHNDWKMLTNWAWLPTSQNLDLFLLATEWTFLLAVDSHIINNKKKKPLNTLRN